MTAHEALLPQALWDAGHRHTQPNNMMQAITGSVSERSLREIVAGRALR